MIEEERIIATFIIFSSIIISSVIFSLVEPNSIEDLSDIKIWLSAIIFSVGLGVLGGVMLVNWI